ncbi:MAG: YHS domain-containing protein [Pseudomonadota bacterium]
METLIYFLLFGVVFFLMMRLGCGSHVMGHRPGGGRSGPGASTAGSGGLRWEPPAKDVDPVCGMTVETATAKSAVHGGAVHYFCSQVCREKFEANPAAYLKKTTEPSPPAEHSHEHRH